MSQQTASEGSKDQPEAGQDQVITSDQIVSDKAPSIQSFPIQSEMDVTPQSEFATKPTEPPSSFPDGDRIRWTASEFVAHHKSVGWYLMLTVVAVAIAAIIWLITKDYFPTIVILVGVLLFGIYAAHKPRELTYELDGRGLAIGNRYFSLSDFRSFAIIPEGAFFSIEFTPLKRFATFITIYSDATDMEKIVNVLSKYLPLEERDKDFVDRLMHQIRY